MGADESNLTANAPTEFPQIRREDCEVVHQRDRENVAPCMEVAELQAACRILGIDRKKCQPASVMSDCLSFGGGCGSVSEALKTLHGAFSQCEFWLRKILSLDEKMGTTFPETHKGYYWLKAGMGGPLYDNPSELAAATEPEFVPKLKGHAFPDYGTVR